MKLNKDEILVLRTCNSDMTSRDGFKYPKRGRVEAKDWEPTYKCGHGLHGFPRGEGEGTLVNWGTDAVWQVLVVSTAKYNYLHGGGELVGKCKFRRGRVIYSGDRKGATDLVLSVYPDAAVIGCYKTGGDRATLMGGYGATLTAGDWATLTGGYGATLTAGDGATLTGGDGATLTAGDWATLCWRVWDGAYYRMHTFYVGEDGVEPNVAYRLYGKKLVRA